MRRWIALAGAVLLAACGSKEPAAEQANETANAPADVDVLPADESAATPSNQLANGAVEPPAIDGNEAIEAAGTNSP